ncbi:hypothetical protein [Nitrosovibrio sp. Nv4]|uniref:hypothetical protein n=1 Tax=Nitrosovibrio sp. Nv4 TaxID=1945880 RepID=UPI000BD704D7|nr:hypothetical protein [Nitrosovibrio sp. Nv4]SOD40919.1 hypothetical protein SAMN06298226_1203 [Nitrosovibrio sp. Nv4]
MSATGVLGDLFGIPNNAHQLRLTVFQLIFLLLKQAENGFGHIYLAEMTVS